MEKQRQGKQAEALAYKYLKAKGLKLIAKNYRCRLGEIDLIMHDHDDMLVFVEVRYRKNTDFGGAIGSVDQRKQSKLIATALHYLQACPNKQGARFDVVAVDGDSNIQWVVNAFDCHPHC